MRLAGAGLVGLLLTGDPASIRAQAGARGNSATASPPAAANPGGMDALPPGLLGAGNTRLPKPAAAALAGVPVDSVTTASLITAVKSLIAAEKYLVKTEAAGRGDYLNRADLGMRQALYFAQLALDVDEGRPVPAESSWPVLPEGVGSPKAGKVVPPSGRTLGANMQATLSALTDVLVALKQSEAPGRDAYLKRATEGVNFAVDNLYAGVYLGNGEAPPLAPRDTKVALVLMVPATIFRPDRMPPGTIFSSGTNVSILGVEMPTLYGSGKDKDLQAAMVGLYLAQEFLGQATPGDKGDYLPRARLGVQKALEDVRGAIDVDDGKLFIPSASAASLPPGVGTPAYGLRIPPLTNPKWDSPNMEMALHALNDTLIALQRTTGPKQEILKQGMADVVFALDNANAAIYNGNELPIPAPALATPPPAPTAPAPRNVPIPK